MYSKNSEKIGERGPNLPPSVLPIFPLRCPLSERLERLKIGIFVRKLHSYILQKKVQPLELIPPGPPPVNFVCFKNSNEIICSFFSCQDHDTQPENTDLATSDVGLKSSVLRSSQKKNLKRSSSDLTLAEVSFRLMMSPPL